MHNPDSEQYQIARADSTLPLGSLVQHVVDGREANVQVTNLDNGITVVSESPVFPGTVDVNVLLNVGTRDEQESESGACLSMRNSYLKTILATNETINYGMVQMSGGMSQMLYDHESSQYRTSCLAHDTQDIFNMISDCALEPKNVIAANVAIEKNKHAHALEGVHDSGVRFRDMLQRTAFGLGGLGNSMHGLQSNLQNLTATTLQKFQIKNYTPDRIFVGGAGVENHEEFVEMVQNKLSFIPHLGNAADPNFRPMAQYRGGEQRIASDSNTMDIAVCFQGASWTDADVSALQIAATLVGNSNSFAEQTRSSSHLRSARNVTGVHNFVDSFGSINQHFSDSGLFGLRISGQSSNANELVDVLVNEFTALRDNVTDDELRAAKGTLKLKMLMGLERQSDRLSETMQNIRTYGRVVHPSYVSTIESVTAQQVRDAVAKVMGTKVTFVAAGGDVGALLSLSELEAKLR